MAGTGVYGLTRLTALAAGDVMPVVHISDTAQNAHGSLDSITVTNYFASIPVPVVVTSTSQQLSLNYDGTHKATFAVSSAGLLTINATTTITITPATTFSGAITASAGVVVAASQAITGTVASSTITGFLSVTATTFVGALTGNISGSAATVTGAAQTAITSVGTLTSLAVTGALSSGALTATTGLYSGDVTLSSATGQNVHLVRTGATTFDMALYVSNDKAGAYDNTHSRDIWFYTPSTNVLTFSPSIASLTVLGTITATTFVGNLTGNVTGNVSGTAATVTGAAQTAITSVGTLSALTVTATITGSVSGSSGSCTGNAATVTNGVYTTGAGTVYVAPSVTSLASLTSVGGAFAINGAFTGATTGAFSGNVLLASAGGSSIEFTRSSAVALDMALFLGNDRFGAYDYTHSRDIWIYAPSTNVLTFAPAVTLSSTLACGALTATTGLFQESVAGTYVAATSTSHVVIGQIINTASAATGVNAFLLIGGSGNALGKFGYVQNAAGYADFVWNQYNGTYLETMRLTSAGALSVLGAVTLSSTLGVAGLITATGGVVGNVTGNVSGTAATVTGAAQTAITSVGTLSALTVTATITGSVSGTAATVTGAAQTAITSVGTLTSLASSGAITGASFSGIGGGAFLVFSGPTPLSTFISNMQLGDGGSAHVTTIGGTGYGAGVASLRLNGLTTAATANLVGTLTNSPVTGNPTFWMPVNIAGNVKYVPCF